MEKIERWIYGFLFLLGGVFLLIYAGISLINLLPKTVFYFLFAFAIIVMLYGVILILIGTLIISVNVRVKKGVALIIFLIGILIVIVSITVIIIYSFNTANIFEIFSGIGVIYLGIRLFFPNEEKKKKEKKILGIVLFIIGLIISVSFGFVLIMMVPYKLESILYAFPFLLLPFLIGIILLIYSIFSIKKRKYKTVLLILRGIFILLILLYILVLFIFPRGSLAFY